MMNQTFPCLLHEQSTVTVSVHISLMKFAMKGGQAKTVMMTESERARWRGTGARRDREGTESSAQRQQGWG